MSDTTMELTKDEFVEMTKAEARNAANDVLEQHAEKLEEQLARLEGMTKAQQDEHKRKAWAAINRKSTGGDTDKGFVMAQAIQAAVYAKLYKGSVGGAAEAAEEAGAPVDVVKALQGAEVEGDKLKIATKANSASTLASGGALVEEVMVNDFIEAKYNRSPIRSMGARQINVGPGGCVIGQNATATAYWNGENEAGTTSEPTFRQVKLQPKKCMVLVPMSRDLVRHGRNALGIIREDMLNVAAVAEDAKFLRGAGGGGAPQGIRSLVDSGQLLDANATVNLTNVYADLMKCLYKVDSGLQSAGGSSYGWLMSSREKHGLMRLLSSDGYPVFAEQLMGGQLLGYRLAVDDNIPNNLDESTGGNDNESEIYFGAFGHLYIGDGLDMEIEVSTEASYVSNATTYHTFQRDQLTVRLIFETDCALRHDKAFAVLEETVIGATLDT